MIHYFEIQPFIVTLAGMFLARGLCYAITVDAVSITKPGYVAVAEHTFTLPGDMYVTTAVVVSLVAVLVGMYVLHYTRLGRNVYAIGGNAAVRAADGAAGRAGRRSPSTRSAASARRSAA